MIRLFLAVGPGGVAGCVESGAGRHVITIDPRELQHRAQAVRGAGPVPRDSAYAGSADRGTQHETTTTASLAYPMHDQYQPRKNQNGRDADQNRQDGGTHTDPGSVCTDGHSRWAASLPA